jgi:hypothetical protein
MYIYTIQCTLYTYGCSQPCLTLLTSCILVTCNNYIRIEINLITNQQLFCNKCMALNNTYNHATCIHFHRLIYMNFNLFATNMHLYFNLKFEIQNFEIWAKNLYVRDAW